MSKSFPRGACVTVPRAFVRFGVPGRRRRLGVVIATARYLDGGEQLRVRCLDGLLWEGRADYANPATWWGRWRCRRAYRRSAALVRFLDGQKGEP